MQDSMKVVENDTKESTKLIIFTIYTIIYEVLIWSLFLYLIVYQGWNEWTILVAIIMSSAQLKPRHFGITVPEKSVVNMDEYKPKQ